ncbi:hypothetical protein ABIC10_005466 [Bradyrhizobium sp. S3.2.12]
MDVYRHDHADGRASRPARISQSAARGDGSPMSTPRSATAISPPTRSAATGRISGRPDSMSTPSCKVPFTISAVPEITASRRSRRAPRGGAASVEGGYPFKFAGGNFIESQAQMVYQNIHINDASDVAAQIRFADVTSLAARIGARFGRTWAIDDGARTITAWIRPNLWNEFLGNPRRCSPRRPVSSPSMPTWAVSGERSTSASAARSRRPQRSMPMRPTRAGSTVAALPTMERWAFGPIGSRTRDASDEGLPATKGEAGIKQRRLGEARVTQNRFIAGRHCALNARAFCSPAASASTI